MNKNEIIKQMDIIVKKQIGNKISKKQVKLIGECIKELVFLEQNYSKLNKKLQGGLLNTLILNFCIKSKMSSFEVVGLIEGIKNELINLSKRDYDFTNIKEDKNIKNYMG